MLFYFKLNTIYLYINWRNIEHKIVKLLNISLLQTPLYKCSSPCLLSNSYHLFILLNSSIALISFYQLKSVLCIVIFLNYHFSLKKNGRKMSATMIANLKKILSTYRRYVILTAVQIIAINQIKIFLKKLHHIMSLWNL